MTKPVSLPSFEMFVQTGRYEPPRTDREKTNQEEKRVATDDELELTRRTLAIMIDRYNLKRYAIMRAVGLGNSTYPNYFNGEKPVPYNNLEKLSELFLCKSVGQFFKLHEHYPPKGLASHLKQLDLVSTISQ